MKKILTIGGSSSKNSMNKKLAEYAGGLLKNIELITVDLNEYEMPLFSVDNEAKNGFSDNALKLNALLDEVDGFVISLAEHNGAYSAAFKNTFDWLSRIEGNVWRNKPMLLLAASPGARGGQSVLEIALGRFPYQGAKIVSSMSFPSFYDNFIENEIVNSELKLSLLTKVQEFENSI